MRKVKRNTRNAEVKRTGKIPLGSEVHHRHLRNPSFEYLRRVIRKTKALISSGECHPDWGRKRLEALQKMLEAKKNRLQRQCMRDL
jgi:hypothetical protein